jgi:hypothetical protein
MLLLAKHNFNMKTLLIELSIYNVSNSPPELIKPTSSQLRLDQN